MVRCSQEPTSRAQCLYRLISRKARKSFPVMTSKGFWRRGGTLWKDLLLAGVNSRLHRNHIYIDLPHCHFGLPRWVRGKESTCRCRRHRFDPWGREDPLEVAVTTHSSLLAWRIPWTEGPGGLQSMGSQRIRRN